MTRAQRRGRAATSLVAVLLLLPVFATGADDYPFMPKGGKALALEKLAPADLKEAAAAKRSEDEWNAWVAGRAKLTDRERATLSAYLAVNMPADASSLPTDGRDLATNECQSCHSLFSGYLTQSRDAQAWRNIFLSPFHRQMKLTEREREEFARYSALNMPLKVEEIPADLRF